MTSSRPGRERRLSRRIRLVQALSGTETAPGAEVIKLRDLSREAFSLETPDSFTLGSVLEFNFTTADGTSPIPTAKVKRCKKSMAVSGSGQVPRRLFVRVEDFRRTDQRRIADSRAHEERRLDKATR